MPPQLKWFLLFVIAGVVIVSMFDRYMPERADIVYLHGRMYTKQWLLSMTGLLELDRPNTFSVNLKQRR